MAMCEECGVFFKSVQALKAHRAFVHKVKGDVLTFKCIECKKTFNVKAKLNRHVRQVHKSKDVTGDVCGKAFATVSGLTQHKSLLHDIKSDRRQTGRKEHHAPPKDSMDIAIEDVLEKVRRDEHIDDPVTGEFEDEEMSGIKLPMDETLYTLLSEKEQEKLKKEHMAGFVAAYAEDHPLLIRVRASKPRHSSTPCGEGSWTALPCQ